MSRVYRTEIWSTVNNCNGICETYALDFRLRIQASYKTPASVINEPEQVIHVSLIALTMAATSQSNLHSVAWDYHHLQFANHAISTTGVTQPYCYSDSADLLWELGVIQANRGRPIHILAPSPHRITFKDLPAKRMACGIGGRPINPTIAWYLSVVITRLWVDSTARLVPSHTQPATFLLEYRCVPRETEPPTFSCYRFSLVQAREWHCRHMEISLLESAMSWTVFTYAIHHVFSSIMTRWDNHDANWGWTQAVSTSRTKLVPVTLIY